MSPFRKVILFALAAILTIVMFTTWGSIGSVIMLLCLLLMGAALVYQHFLINRDNEEYQSDY